MKGNEAMTSSASDNIEQAVDGAFRSAVTQAAALGRMVAQMREHATQRATRQEETKTAEIQRRHATERQYAHVMLAQADHDGWWNTASTEQVASVVATAQAWKDRDPEIAKVAGRVDDRAQARWGINPSARIDALSPAQRHHEAQQLSTILALDDLDTNDPLHSLVTEYRQSEASAQHGAEQEAGEVSKDQEAEHAQPDSGSKTTSATQTAREHTLGEFEQLLRSTGMDEKTITAHMLPERANTKPATEAVNVQSPTTA